MGTAIDWTQLSVEEVLHWEDQQLNDHFPVVGPWMNYLNSLESQFLNKKFKKNSSA